MFQSNLDHVRCSKLFSPDSYISHISCDVFEYEQKSSIVPFLVRQRTLFISLHVDLSREDSNSQDLKLLPNNVYRITASLPRARLLITTVQSHNNMDQPFYLLPPKCKWPIHTHHRYLIEIYTRSVTRSPHIKLLDRQQEVSSSSSATIHILCFHLATCLCPRCSPGSRGIQCSPKPLSNHDSYPPSNSHARMRQYCTADACREAGEQHDTAHGDEHAGDGGHHLSMLDNEVVKRVLQPKWRILCCCGDCVVAFLVSNMTVIG